MNSSDEDSNNSITIISDTFESRNERPLVNGESNSSENTSSGHNNETNTASNPLPWTCRFCGLVYPLLEQVKNHFESTHIAHKAIQCELEKDFDFEESESIDNDVHKSQNIVHNENNISNSSQSITDCDPKHGNLSAEERQISNSLLNKFSHKKCSKLLDKRVSFSSTESSPPDDESQQIELNAPNIIHNFSSELFKPDINTNHLNVKVTKKTVGTTIPRTRKANSQLPPKVLHNILTISPKKLKALEKERDLIPVPKISDWFANYIPLKSPYFPQIDDKVKIFVSAYREFISKLEPCIQETEVLKECKHSLDDFSNYIDITGIVKDIVFKYRKYNNCEIFILVMRIEIIDPLLKPKKSFVNTLWCNKPSPDFIILEKSYTSITTWLVGDRFRILQNNAWWLGEITKFEPKTEGCLYQCFEVRYDTDDIEWLSPWDLYQINQSRKPKKSNAGTPLYEDEIPLLLSQPELNAWPNDGRDAICERIKEGLEFFLDKNIGNLFSDKNTDLHGLDLNIVIQRLKYKYYRRLKSLCFDIDLLKQSLYERKKGDKVKFQKAKIVMLGIKEFIEGQGSQSIKSFLEKRLPSSDLEVVNVNNTETEPSQPTGKRRRKNSKEVKEVVNKKSHYEPQITTVTFWQENCIKMIDQVSNEVFAKPFMEPVKDTDFPDYHKVIKHPIDLGTMKKRLQEGYYSQPEEFKKDTRLIICNSRAYNTRKDTWIYKYTTNLQDYLEREVQKIIDEYNTAVRLERRINTTYC
ncbi:bromodomain and WD repeat-containing protein 3-like protein [Dinothrombium tinctorium]|uniref:Bromodomain and WD repeat-containing protein 3-like protein n=1 Tax=Dinothrombium tinctorium TaxID=1965070 RepID=A0A443R4B7_9ACAR|nr:bromodomain and WD repeat-containing protein 3-like protein [Dinothrombium tinctorium]